MEYIHITRERRKVRKTEVKMLVTKTHCLLTHFKEFYILPKKALLELNLTKIKLYSIHFIYNSIPCEYFNSASFFN